MKNDSNHVLNINLKTRFSLYNFKNSIIYSEFFGRLVLLPIFRRGIRQFEKSGMTSKSSYRAMRKLFGNNNPSLFQSVANNQLMNLDMKESEEMVRGLASSEIPRLVDELFQNGFAILSEPLDKDKCQALQEIAAKAVCDLVDASNELRSAVFDAQKPIAVRYEISEADLLKSEVVQEILCDRSLYEIAKRYLGCNPIQDLVTMWWSTSINHDASSKAAQQFHFDLDRLKFLKLFIYLTDVSDMNGPHVYIKGSHRNMPSLLRRDGRHSDINVSENYPNCENKITGSQGLVFLADTRGLHKGMPLIEGNRLIFQTEYASSLFGYPYLQPCLSDVSEELITMNVENPTFLKRFKFE
jgi:hypothetical protein